MNSNKSIQMRHSTPMHFIFHFNYLYFYIRNFEKSPRFSTSIQKTFIYI